MAKENTYKNQKNEKPTNETASTKKVDSQKATPKKKTASKLSKINSDERTWKIVGLLSVGLSLFLVVALFSFYFTHTFDQSFIHGDVEEPVKNWAGKAGAYLSHFLVMHLGIGAFILVPVFLLTGLNLLTGTKYISQLKLIVMSLSGYVWLSTLLAAIIPDGSSVDVLHGRFGWGMEQLIAGWIGRVGLWFLLIISIGLYGIIAFNMSFSFVSNFIEKWKPSNFNFRRNKDDDEMVEEDNSNKSEEDLMNEAAMLAANIFSADKKVKDIQDFEPSVEEDPFIVDEIVSKEQSNIPDFLKDPIMENTVDVSTNELDVDAPELEILPENLEEQIENVMPIIPPITPPVTPVMPVELPEINTEIPTENSNENIAENNPESFVFDLDNTKLNKANKSSEEPSFVIEESVQEGVVENLNAVDPASEGDFSLDTPYDPTLDLPNFKMPEPSILLEHGSGGIKINKEELEANKDKIVNTLNNYNIQIDQIKATVGPTVTLYEIVPAPGVRISKIKNLEDDIALSLAALGIRIIAPIPGKGTIGIEVPNQTPEVVSMRSVITSEKFVKSTFDLPVGLGKTISNETFVTDLAKMPHLLMAGATGQGKSVGLNAILVSLLYKKHPSQLKFVLVDPKKVELTLFNKIERHYLAKLPGEDEAIITNTQKVINTLNSLCIEMDQRYDLLKNAGVRQLKEYNAKFISRRLNPNKGHRFLPYIVLVVDEFADLIMTAGKEVELPIARLAQLARAVGIHLIIATQRPSVNIITGTIKANFPARIAFRVSSKVDSRTILDSGGAEQLIGRGDMLLSLGSDLIRLQCAFVDTPEVEELTEFIGNQRGYSSAFELPEYVGEETGQSADFSINDRDSLFEDAARIIVSTQQGSTSMLQRRLKLGYNRAGRLMDQLEAAGIVGPNEGSKPRHVLYQDEISLEQFLDTLK